MSRMLIHTRVPTQDGEVLVSTTSKSSLGRFETIVFPIGSDGAPILREEYTDYSEKPREAKRTHRSICQMFDISNRLYSFIAGEYRPNLQVGATA
jgi:hypothetical protein